MQIVKYIQQNKLTKTQYKSSAKPWDCIKPAWLLFEIPSIIWNIALLGAIKLIRGTNWFGQNQKLYRMFC